MSIKWIVLFTVGLVITTDAYAGEPASLKTAKDKINYSIGVSTIRNFKQYGSDSDIDLEMVLKGMKDELKGKDLLMSEKELRSALTTVQTQIMQKKRTSRALATMTGSTAPVVTENTKP